MEGILTPISSYPWPTYFGWCGARVSTDPPCHFKSTGVDFDGAESFDEEMVANPPKSGDRTRIRSCRGWIDSYSSQGATCRHDRTDLTRYLQRLRRSVYLTGDVTYFTDTRHCIYHKQAQIYNSCIV
jgi:hypothetical protein